MQISITVIVPSPVTPPTARPESNVSRVSARMMRLIPQMKGPVERARDECWRGGQGESAAMGYAQPRG